MTNKELANRLIQKGTELLLNESLGFNGISERASEIRAKKAKKKREEYIDSAARYVPRAQAEIMVRNLEPDRSEQMYLHRVAVRKNDPKLSPFPGAVEWEVKNRHRKNDSKTEFEAAKIERRTNPYSKYKELTPKEKALEIKQTERTLADAEQHPGKYPKGYAERLKRQLGLNNECIATLLIEAAELLNEDNSIGQFDEIQNIINKKEYVDYLISIAEIYNPDNGLANKKYIKKIELYGLDVKMKTEDYLSSNKFKGKYHKIYVIKIKDGVIAVDEFFKKYPKLVKYWIR